ncbi:BZ3500_MvSof-1268-A1-R1_Chr3-1g05776 [Microbotryum saponariae]|uniref:BZ3500_MvSof-1268-A1-R1_Chr3-1g05776 protein n=1 Tax=Microbotryum saponariae TaxID=289078 RepID=A0A2X0L0V6_9BASI|nr:BZ3500_MvSof-1268-A1-R1_Chr3-1g05776 [Microbotryum saponariae]SDA04966.1 BZ3501_MvSof-1269-A2-R1_Chr3-1g05446 [Microbotryum saponariae]
MNNRGQAVRRCAHDSHRIPKLATSKAPQRRRRYKAHTLARSIAEGSSSILSAEWSRPSASPSTHDPKGPSSIP